MHRSVPSMASVFRRLSVAPHSCCAASVGVCVWDASVVRPPCLPLTGPPVRSFASAPSPRSSASPLNSLCAVASEYGGGEWPDAEASLGRALAAIARGCAASNDVSGARWAIQQAAKLHLPVSEDGGGELLESLSALVRVVSPSPAALRESIDALATASGVSGSGAALAELWDTALIHALESINPNDAPHILSVVARAGCRVSPAAVDAVVSAWRSAAWHLASRPSRVPFDITADSSTPVHLPATSLSVPPPNLLPADQVSSVNPATWPVLLTATVRLSHAPEQDAVQHLRMLRGYAELGDVKAAVATLASLEDLPGYPVPDWDVVPQFDALLRAFEVASHPNRALRGFAVMKTAGVSPSLSAFDSLLSVLKTSRRPDAVVLALQDCVATGHTPPASLFVNAMESLAQAQAVPDLMAVLSMAQSCGHLTTVNSFLPAGRINLSGLSNATVTVLLLELVHQLREEVLNGTYAAPTSLAVFHSPPSRRLIKKVLGELDPPLPVARRNWMSEVGTEDLVAFFTSPTIGGDE